MSPMRNSVEGDGPVNHFLLMRPQSLSHFVGELSLVEVLDIFDKMKVVGPRACFSDIGLSHRTFDQVIDTKFGSVVGPRS